jgi:hypothetical protein
MDESKQPSIKTLLAKLDALEKKISQATIPLVRSEEAKLKITQERDALLAQAKVFQLIALLIMLLVVSLFISGGYVFVYAHSITTGDVQKAFTNALSTDMKAAKTIEDVKRRLEKLKGQQTPPPESEKDKKE